VAGSDAQRTGKWLYQKLNGDATLTGLGLAGVYRGNAPPGSAYPFARITLETMTVAGGNGGIHVLSVMQWRIVVIDATSSTRTGRSFDQLRPIAERIITLLDGAADFTSDLSIADVVRVEEIEREYNEDGIDYREVGMIWRVIARAAD
jgi:hypothetical protein